MNYKEIEEANKRIKTTDIRGKQYAEVNQRIKAFRMLYPQGFIRTQIISIEDGVCITKAECGFYQFNDGDSPSFHKEVLLGVGHAYEKENSTFINKTSYIENCETSAVGRALGMAGIGIDTSVASYEEVSNAIANQGTRTASPKQIEVLKNAYKGDNLTKLLEVNNVRSIEEIPMEKASELIGKLKERK